MVNLSRWYYNGISLWGMCQGHPKFSDGTYIYTSQVTKIEVCDDGLDFYTDSNIHYHCKTEDIMLDALENIKAYLEYDKIDTSFLDGIGV